jgi:hypothetical protein
MRNPNASDSLIDADTVLANVRWIVDQLDGDGLCQVDDLPVLELAKHIAVGSWRAA